MIDKSVNQYQILHNWNAAPHVTKCSNFSDIKIKQKASQSMVGILIMQMPIKWGIQDFGDVAQDALYKEFKQMIDKYVYTALHAKSLRSTKIECQQILP